MDRVGPEADDHDARVRRACLRQVAPLARSLTFMTPVSVLLMLVLSRADTVRGAVWAGLVVVPALVAAAMTPTGRPPVEVLERWQGWYRWYLFANLLTWAAVLGILRPPDRELEVQTAQLLVLVAVGTSLVLLGAFLPRTFRVAMAIFGASVTIGLLVWGIGVNRQLALMVPVYVVILLQMQHFMRTATVRSIQLAIENEHLLGELGTEQARLEHEASHDHLTGLLNRPAFLDLVECSLDRPAGDRRVCIFKLVNDLHGHVAGDQVLTEVADRLHGAVREGDVIGRFGGDEFTVLLAGIPGPEVARQAGERIVAAFDRPFLVDGLELSVGVSVGIGIAAGPDSSADGLIRLADRAVYAAKAAGRHRVVVEELGPDRVGH
jgi:diguanylate cyclase (GGDEF)-like protein